MRKTTKKIVMENILMLIPFILYGVYKNGFLVYSKGFISIWEIFKPIYLVLISIILKFIIDIIKYRKIKIDYNLLISILVALIMPTNINLIIYSLVFLLTYVLSTFLEKYLNFNKVCFIYLIIILINFLFKDFTFKNILEEKIFFSYSFWDILMGRSIGGISSTSIFFSLIFYAILTFNFYYKKDIPFAINITYLLLMFLYYLVTHNNELLLNSEVIFGSIFVSSLPIYSPYKKNRQIIFGVLIGIFTFIISIAFNSVISIYLATFIVSLLFNLKVLVKK